MTHTDFVDWLLQSEIPSIRYFTRRDLLDEPESELQTVRQQMLATGPIPEILFPQSDDGNWYGERNYYSPKYVSTHWSMHLLYELGIEGNHEGFQRGVASMLRETVPNLDREFDVNHHGFECFWGNLLRYALHAGQQDDARVQRIIDYLTHDLEKKSWRCRSNDELPCAWGASRALWGLAGLPESERDDAFRATVEHALDFLLEQHPLVEASYPTPGTIHKMWHKLNYPLFYQGDILFVLRVLGELDALDRPGAQAALDWLISKRKSNGRWQGSSPYRQRTWRHLGDKTETQRWVSLHAAIILKRAKRPWNE